MVGGPVDAMAAGKVASTAGIGAEWAMSTTIDDANAKDNTGDVRLQRIMADSVMVGATGGTSGGIMVRQGSSAATKPVRRIVDRELESPLRMRSVRL